MTKTDEAAAEKTAAEKLVYRSDEACKAIGVGNTTLYGLIRDGKLKAKKSGRLTVITRAELERYVESMPDAR